MKKLIVLAAVLTPLLAGAAPAQAQAQANRAADKPSMPALQQLLESGRVDSAVATLEGSVGENPFDPVQLNNLAVAKARGGDVYTALQLLDRAARLAPEQPIILDNRSKLREWFSSRIGANAVHLRDAVPVRDAPTQLPDPPPLWAE